MIPRKPPDFENKLLILSAVERLGPLTNLQLLTFLAEADGMDYITLQLALGELKEAGQLTSEPHALGPMYALTGEGRAALSLFSRRLPHSRAQALADAPNWRRRFQREKQLMADFYRREDEGYDLRLRLLEDGQPLLDMTLALPTREEADRLSRRWPDAAAAFYGHLMAVLGEGEPAKNQDGPLPSGAALVSGERGLTLRLPWGQGGLPALHISLELPTQAMARHFAERWEGEAPRLMAFLLEGLSAL